MTGASTVAIVPAAGAARRFGGGKLTADLGGRPLLDHTLQCLLGGGIDTVMLVTAAPGAFAGVPSVHDARVIEAVNPDPSRGMFSSIRVGLEALSSPPGRLVVLPADMPFVQPDTVAALLAAARAGQALVPTYGGRRGHPVVLPGTIWEGLRLQPATSTLKEAIAALRVDLAERPGDDPGVLRDVDWRVDLNWPGG